MSSHTWHHISTQLSRHRARGAGAALSSKVVGGRSVLAGLRQSGALKVLFPAPRGESTLQAILVNTSGGVTGGDRLA